MVNRRRTRVAPVGSDETALQQLRQQLEAHRQAVRDLEAALEAQSTLSAAQALELAQAREQIDIISRRLERLQLELRAYQAEIGVREREIADLNRSLADAAARAAYELEASDAARQALQTEIGQLRNELDAMAEQERSARADAASSLRTVQDMQQLARSLVEALAAANRRSEEQDVRLRECEEEVQNLQNQLDAARDELEARSGPTDDDAGEVPGGGDDDGAPDDAAAPANDLSLEERKRIIDQVLKTKLFVTPVLTEALTRVLTTSASYESITALMGRRDRGLAQALQLGGDQSYRKIGNVDQVQPLLEPTRAVEAVVQAAGVGLWIEKARVRATAKETLEPDRKRTEAVYKAWTGKPGYRGTPHHWRRRE